MCGIVGFVTGYSNGLAYNEADMFQDMLFVDTLRGVDSTGVFSVDYNSNVDILKEATHGLRFISSGEFKQFKGKLISRGQFVVGHNRAATRGVVTDENAHPFYVDDKIVLVQNGTFIGDHKHLKNTEVDTHAIAHVLAEEDNIETALQKVNSAYALVWFNADKQELQILRNDDRPLFVAYTKSGGFVFASEEGTITWAANRNKIELSKAPYLLAPNHLVTYTLKDKVVTSESKDVDVKFRGKPFRGFLPEDIDYYAGEFPHVKSTTYEASNNTLTTNNRRDTLSPKNNKKVDILFADFALNNIDDILYESSTEISNAVSQLDFAVDATGYLFVELIDYVKGNLHSDCTSWHVYGSVVSPNIDTEHGPTPVIHWIVYNKTEAEIMEYVHQSFYQVAKSTTIVRKLIKDNKKRYLVAAYGSNVREVTAHTAAVN